MTCESTKSSAALDLPGGFERKLKFLVKVAITLGWKAYSGTGPRSWMPTLVGILQGYTWALQRPGNSRQVSLI